VDQGYIYGVHQFGKIALWDHEGKPIGVLYDEKGHEEHHSFYPEKLFVDTDYLYITDKVDDKIVHQFDKNGTGELI
jgi:hypothetical protein